MPGASEGWSICHACKFQCFSGRLVNIMLNLGRLEMGGRQVGASHYMVCHRAHTEHCISLKKTKQEPFVQNTEMIIV